MTKATHRATYNTPPQPARHVANDLTALTELLNTKVDLQRVLTRVKNGATIHLRVIDAPKADMKRNASPAMPALPSARAAASHAPSRTDLMKRRVIDDAALARLRISPERHLANVIDTSVRTIRRQTRDLKSYETFTLLTQASIRLRDELSPGGVALPAPDQCYIGGAHVDLKSELTFKAVVVAHTQADAEALKSLARLFPTEVSAHDYPNTFVVERRLLNRLDAGRQPVPWYPEVRGRVQSVWAL